MKLRRLLLSHNGYCHVYVLRHRARTELEVIVRSGNSRLTGWRRLFPVADGALPVPELYRLLLDMCSLGSLPRGGALLLQHM